jgi:phage tail sheath protein FI
VYSFNEFQRIYGGYLTDSLLAYEVEAFFSNGGSACYISRVLSTGSNVKASFLLLATAAATAGALTSTAGVFPVALVAGGTFTGKVDGGGAATLTIAATAGSVTGAAATFAAVTVAHELVISIVGRPGFQRIAFAGTEDTLQKWLDALNAQLDGARAYSDGGQVKIETDMEGTTASGYIDADSDSDVIASLGLSVGDFDTPGTGDVGDISAVTAAEFKTLMEDAFAGSTVVDNGNGSVTWATDTLGAAGSVQFTAGTCVALVSGFDTTAHAGSAAGTQNVLTVTATGEGTYGNNLKIVAAKEDVRLGSGIPTIIAGGPHTTFDIGATLAAKVTVGDQIKLYDPTTSAVARGYVTSIREGILTFSASVTTVGNLTVANTEVYNETFSLAVYEDRAVVQGPIKGLRMSSLSSRDYFATRINTDAQENQITVTVATPNIAQGDPRPVNTTVGGDFLAGGTEANTFNDLDYIGSSVTKTGMYAFDKKKDVRQLSACGITGSVSGVVSKALVAYAENRTDCIAVIAPPVGLTPAQIATFKNDVIGSSSYGVMLGQWIQILDPLTRQRSLVPPTGAWMGMTARTDRDVGVAQAPAGETVGRLIGALAIERIELDDAERGVLYQANVNPIEWITGVGVCAMGSRTLEQGEFEQINIRRTFIYLRTSMQLGTRWVVFAGNTKATRARVRRSLSGFLKNEWRKGNLEGDTEADAFYVICDERNNTAYTINEGKMYIRVGVKIPKTTEFVIIEIEQSQAGLDEAA